MKRRYLALGMLTLAMVLTGCGSKTESDVTIIGGADGPTSIFLASKNDKDSYTQIDQETAKLMMDLDDGHVIVDVRRQDEYDEGHIPGAICIPNESITDSMPSELPDLEQIITDGAFRQFRFRGREFLLGVVDKCISAEDASGCHQKQDKQSQQRINAFSCLCHITYPP